MIANLPVAMVLAILSFIVFRMLYRRSKSRTRRAVVLVTALIFTLPATTFLTYYVVKWPYDVWYINLRSLAGAECASGLAFGLVGVITAIRLRWGLPHAFLTVVSFLLACALLFVPFAKQAIYPMNYSTLGNSWKDGACYQTSCSTCVPASCASTVRSLGGNLSERELARAAGTTIRGTEIWYMKRALRRRGYIMDARVVHSPRDLSAPSILGVGNHVVAMLSQDRAGVEIADPLGTRQRCSWKALATTYHIDAIYFPIRAARP